MRKAVVFTMILMMGLGSVALARPLSTRMSCEEAKLLVKKTAPLVMSTGPKTYDRFVVHIGQCALGEVLKPGLAPTRDKEKCFVGFICHPNSGGV